jgi:predicted DNA-binding transcriptional regulator YafY
MEINSFITFMSVSGGAMMSSDKLSLLGDKEIDKIKSLYPLNQSPAIALDLYEREIPSIFKYENTGEYEMYALINWIDVEDSFEINVKVALSPMFLSWVMNFGSDMKVLSPKSVQEKIANQAKEIIEQYK